MPDISGCGWLLRAYFDLATERPMGMGGLLPIPISVIAWYGDRWQLGDDFIALIQGIDRALIRGQEDGRTPHH